MLKERNRGLRKITPYPFWLKAPIILFGLCLLVIILKYGKFILMPLAFSALFSMLLNPVIKRLGSWGVGRVMSIVLPLSMITVILAGLITLLTIQIVQFSDSLPDIIDEFKSTSYEGIYLIERITGIDEAKLTEYIKNVMEILFETGGKFMSSLAESAKGALIFLGLLPIFIFFMLYYKEMYRTFLEKTFVESHNSDIDTVKKKYKG